MIKKIALLSLNFIKSYLFISLVVVIALSLAIWFLGPRLNLFGVRPLVSELSRLVAIVIVIALWGLNNLRLHRKVAREAAKALEPEAEPVKPVAEFDPRLDEIDASFDNAISKLVQNLPGGKRTAPYKLPWFLILGREEAGKTSFLASSNFRLPFAAQFGQEDRLNVRPTRLLDWWVGDKGLIIDMAGELTDHRGQSTWPDQAVWKRLLSNLLKFRRRRPLDGAILVLDVKHLITATNEDRVRQSSILRWRLQELISVLGNQIPVYVVLSKLDLIQGFQTVFGRLPQSQRDELLGFTFPVLRYGDEGAWLKEFSEDFDRFVTELQNRLFGQMRDLKTQEERRDAFVFVRQISGLKNLLHDFMREVFLEDEFSTPPLIRGLYFSSAKQEGIPISGLESAVYQSYGLPPAVKTTVENRKKTFFASNVLERVVFPEAGLAGDNFRLARAKRNWRVGASLVAVGVVGFVSLLWYFEFQRNMSGIQTANEFLADLEVEIEDSQETDPTGLAFVEPLNIWQDARSAFGSGNSLTRQIAGLGLYQGHRIGPLINTTYTSRASAPFYENLYEGIEGRLRNYFEVYKRSDQARTSIPSLVEQIEGAEAKSAALTSAMDLLDLSAEARPPLNELLNEIISGSEGWESLSVQLEISSQLRKNEQEKELLELLLVYLVMSNSENQVDPVRVAAVRQEFQRLWGRLKPGEAEVQTDALNHLDFVLNETVQNLEIDVQLVDQIKTQLQRVPSDRRVYQEIRRIADGRLPEITLQDEIGPVFSQVFVGDHGDHQTKVPSLFSAGNFQQFFVAQNANLSETAIRNGWVLDEPTEFTDADIAAFQEAVRRTYVSEFITTWRSTIANLELQPFESLSDAERKLQLITGSGNPYGRFLQSIEKHTRIGDLDPEGAVETGLAGVSSGTLDLANAREVTLAFSDLHNMDELLDGQERSNLDLALQAVENVYTYVKSINEAADSDDKALSLAKERAELISEDPILELRRVANGLPEPFQSHFEQVANETWLAIARSAEARLNELWNEQIYTAYAQDLQGAYPFDPTATAHVSYEKFEEFLSARGKVELFFEEHLSPFVDPVTQRARSIDGYRMAFSGHAINSLNRVRNIQNAFFGDDGAFGLSFSLTPVAMDSGSARSIINIDGQALPYRHGPERTVGFIWPNTLSDTQGSRITFIPVRQDAPNAIVEGNGAWSFFRLIDQAQRNDIRPDSSSVTLNFEQDGRRLAVRIDTLSAVNPFAISLGTELALPAQLIDQDQRAAEKDNL